MDWIERLFGRKKPIIAMCHLHALPGDPQYDPEKGIRWIIDKALQDLNALQDGGVDGVMFSNEYSIPYLTNVEQVTVATMSRIIGELKQSIKIPYGVNVLWDPMATIDLAVATDATFAREVFTGAYAGDFGVWNTDFGRTARHQHRIHGDEIRLLFNIVPEAAAYLASREVENIARSTIFNMNPDALCISGVTAGVETSLDLLKRVKEVVPDFPVFANTGVNVANVKEQLAVADGAVVGTGLKYDGKIWNDVDVKRVKELMHLVKSL